jgi:hypothetical protein
MPKTRNPMVKSRNVRLSISTYDCLNKFLIELSSERGIRLSLNDAVEALMNEHYRSRKK